MSFLRIGWKRCSGFLVILGVGNLACHKPTVPMNPPLISIEIPDKSVGYFIVPVSSEVRESRVRVSVTKEGIGSAIPQGFVQFVAVRYTGGNEIYFDEIDYPPGRQPDRQIELINCQQEFQRGYLYFVGAKRDYEATIRSFSLGLHPPQDRRN
jgi:hypothetical protein